MLILVELQNNYLLDKVFPKVSQNSKKEQFKNLKQKRSNHLS